MEACDALDEADFGAREHPGLLAELTRYDQRGEKVLLWCTCPLVFQRKARSSYVTPWSRAEVVVHADSYSRGAHPVPVPTAGVQKRLGARRVRGSGSEDWDTHDSLGRQAAFAGNPPTPQTQLPTPRVLAERRQVQW